MQADIPEDKITRIEDSNELSRMVFAWNAPDIEFLKEFFDRGGKPYIEFSNKLLGIQQLWGATMLRGCLNPPEQAVSVVPLPLLTVRQHFVRNDGTPDMKAVNDYNTMLDMCIDRGLSIDACDSKGMTLLNNSLAYFSIFSQFLPEPDADDWQESKVSYSSELFDYSVAGILLNRGADPFCRTEDKHYTNILNNAAEGAYGANDRLNCCSSKNPGIWSRRINVFYADVLCRICLDAPNFKSLPFPAYEQRNIVNRVIESGCIQIQSRELNDVSDKFISILEALLSNNIVTSKGLHTYRGKSGLQQVSSLYCLCRGARKAIDHVAYLNSLANTFSTHGSLGYDRRNAESVYSAMKDYFRRVMTLLRCNGADINRCELTGKLPMSGLFGKSSAYRYTAGFPKEFYAYLQDFLAILVQCGWNPDSHDKNGDTIQDYYPNKLEGRKAIEALQKVVNHIEAEKAAYSNFEEEFMR